MRKVFAILLVLFALSIAVVPTCADDTTDYENVNRYVHEYNEDTPNAEYLSEDISFEEATGK